MSGRKGGRRGDTVHTQNTLTDGLKGIGETLFFFYLLQSKQQFYLFKYLE